MRQDMNSCLLKMKKAKENVQRGRLIIEAVIEESRVVALMLLDITCIRILDFNICLYKSVIKY